MKKTIEKEVDFCDVCEKEEWIRTCLICGKDFCYECRKTHMTELTHSVSSSGSGDGQYCNECLSKPIPAKHSFLLEAYREIVSLREEEKEWYADFRIRCEKAEARIKDLQKT